MNQNMVKQLPVLEITEKHSGKRKCKFSELNKLNEIVKKTTEELIVNYLNNEQVSTDENKSNISFEQFDKYIKENSEHIKKFFEKNWPCARYLHTTYALNDLISSFCQIYLLYKAVVAPGEQATVKMAIAVVIYFIVSSSTIEIVEEISINKKLSEIRQFGFEKEIKAKVKKLVTKITGSKNVTVIVTLESGMRYKYADIKEDSSEDKSEESVKLSSSETKQDYITVKTADGGEQALLVTTQMPEIRGVAIVCMGGDNEIIAQKIENTVTAALNITSQRVSIAGGN